MIRVAMPLFETDLAPRFSFAREMLVATVDAGQVISRERLLVESLPWPERIRRLQELHVTVLLASGFDRCQLPMASAWGIEVISGLGGNAEAVLEAYCSGELERSNPAVETERPPRARRQKRERRAGRP